MQILPALSYGAPNSIEAKLPPTRIWKNDDPTTKKLLANLWTALKQYSLAVAANLQEQFQRTPNAKTWQKFDNNSEWRVDGSEDRRIFSIRANQNGIEESFETDLKDRKGYFTWQSSNPRLGDVSAQMSLRVDGQKADFTNQNLSTWRSWISCAALQPIDVKTKAFDIAQVRNTAYRLASTADVIESDYLGDVTGKKAIDANHQVRKNQNNFVLTIKNDGKLSVTKGEEGGFKAIERVFLDGSVLSLVPGKLAPEFTVQDLTEPNGKVDPQLIYFNGIETFDNLLQNIDTTKLTEKQNAPEVFSTLRDEAIALFQLYFHGHRVSSQKQLNGKYTVEVKRYADRNPLLSVKEGENTILEAEINRTGREVINIKRINGDQVIELKPLGEDNQNMISYKKTSGTEDEPRILPLRTSVISENGHVAVSLISHSTEAASSSPVSTPVDKLRAFLLNGGNEESGVAARH